MVKNNGFYSKIRTEMLRIQKNSFGGKPILPCQICGKGKSNCPCRYRCPHLSHEKDRNGNQKLRHLCKNCLSACSHPERVWSELLQQFVAPNNPSLGSGAQQIAHCVQSTQQPRQEEQEETERLWALLDEMKRQEEQEEQEETERLWDLFKNKLPEESDFE